MALEIICKCCGHKLHRLTGMFDGIKDTYEHLNRYQDIDGKYPFSTQACHVVGCNCINPIESYSFQSIN